MDAANALAALRDFVHGRVEVDAEAALDVVFREMARLHNAEARLRARCAGLERAAVGGGVLCGDVPTAEVREAFGWEPLPAELTFYAGVEIADGLYDSGAEPTRWEALDQAERDAGLSGIKPLHEYGDGDEVDVVGVTGYPGNVWMPARVLRSSGRTVLTKLYLPDDEEPTGVLFAVSESSKIRER